MKYPGRIGSAAVLAATALALATVLAGPASAATGRDAGFGGASHVVFVQTDNTAGNQGPSALATFALHSDGTITQIDAVDTGQAATCWVTADGGQLFTSNAGSGNVTGFTSDAQGQLTLLGQTATDPGTVDSSATRDGRFLYVQAGGDGSVDEFSVTAGTLTEIGSVVVPGAVGGEGIAAT